MSHEILPGIKRTVIGYDYYRGLARSADVLLWEPSNPGGWLIAKGTRGPFSHASMVVSAFGRLWQGAYCQGMDGFLSPLSAEVRRNDGRISVFRVVTSKGMSLTSNEADRTAVAFANSLGGDYAWKNIRLGGLSILMIDRLIGRFVDLKGMIARQCRKLTSAVCSQSAHRAVRRDAGIILCPGIEEALVSPNDIGRSDRLVYIGTLAWPGNWKRHA